MIVRPGCAACLIVIACLHATATAAEEDGWTSLMDLGSWRGYQQQEVPKAWRLEEGVLTLDGSGGDLITREQYGDFEFAFDWKIAEGGNSGVIYLASEDHPNSYESGPEYQVLDDAGHPDSKDVNKAGALYDLYGRSVESTKPAGEWNTGRIKLESGRLEHWLNGEKVVDTMIGSDDWNERIAGSKFASWGDFAKSRRGHIALQDHGARVWFRNVRVRPLDAEAQSASRAVRVLMVTQSAGFVHSTVKRGPQELSHAERILTELGVRSGDFRIDCTQDVENDFTPELLDNYDVVAFYTTGDLPIPEETLDWFLNEWLAKEGRGFLGLHTATDTYHEYEPYRSMIGGAFDGHPWTSTTEVVLKLHEGDHPAIKPWGAASDRITLTEEIYQYKHWNPENVRVLMSLDMEATGVKRPYHVPVMWVKPYGAGRVMHINLGHREETWLIPAYQESLIGGVRWLAGLEEGDATPNPEVSAAEEEIARKAAPDDGDKG